MKAMIFAAGLGTRLKPMTDTIPKALVPVCGMPLIGHVMKKLKGHGIDEAVVNVHHFADMVEEWLDAQEWICRDAVDMAEGKMLVHVSDERKSLLETGGAVLHARKFLEGSGSFLIHNADILSDLDVRWLDLQVRPEAMATLLVSPRKSARQLLFEPQTMRLIGWHNLQTGQVRSPYAHIDPSECISLAFSGIHVMSGTIFGAMEKYAASHGLYLGTDTPRFPIMDFYLWACAEHGIFGVSAEKMELIDVGKLETLSIAEEFCKKNLNSFL